MAAKKDGWPFDKGALPGDCADFDDPAFKMTEGRKNLSFLACAARGDVAGAKRWLLAGASSTARERTRPGLDAFRHFVFANEAGCELLLGMGCDPDHAQSDGLLPAYDYALGFDKEEVMASLLRHTDMDVGMVLKKALRMGAGRCSMLLLGALRKKTELDPAEVLQMMESCFVLNQGMGPPSEAPGCFARFHGSKWVKRDARLTEGMFLMALRHDSAKMMDGLLSMGVRPSRDWTVPDFRRREAGVEKGGRIGILQASVPVSEHAGDRVFRLLVSRPVFFEREAEAFCDPGSFFRLSGQGLLALEKAGADIRALGPGGANALHKRIRWGIWKGTEDAARTVASLLTQSDDSGATPLDLAAGFATSRGRGMGGLGARLRAVAAEHEREGLERSTGRVARKKGGDKSI